MAPVSAQCSIQRSPVFTNSSFLSTDQESKDPHTGGVAFPKCGSSEFGESQTRGRESIEGPAFGKTGLAFNLGGPRMYQFSTALGYPCAPNSLNAFLMRSPRNFLMRAPRNFRVVAMGPPSDNPHRARASGRFVKIPR